MEVGEAAAVLHRAVRSGELAESLRQHHRHLNDGEFAQLIQGLLAMLATIEGLLARLAE